MTWSNNHGIANLDTGDPPKLHVSAHDTHLEARDDLCQMICYTGAPSPPFNVGLLCLWIKHPDVSWSGTLGKSTLRLSGGYTSVWQIPMGVTFPKRPLQGKILAAS